MASPLESNRSSFETKRTFKKFLKNKSSKDWIQKTKLKFTGKSYSLEKTIENSVIHNMGRTVEDFEKEVEMMNCSPNKASTQKKVKILEMLSKKENDPYFRAE